MTKMLDFESMMIVNDWVAAPYSAVVSTVFGYSSIDKRSDSVDVVIVEDSVVLLSVTVRDIVTLENSEYSADGWN